MTSTGVHPDAENLKVTREGSGNEVPVTVMMSAPLVERALDGDVVKIRRGMKGRIAVDDVGVEPKLIVDPWPNCPKSFLPQHLTLDDEKRAHT